MKTVITPEFVKNFSCIADKCEDHCCHGWDIHIDKPTYSFMTKKSDLKIKSQQVIVRTRSADSYAKINLNENGNCPFREQTGLCEIHKAHGHSRLSNTCQSYPRVNTFRGEQAEQSLSLSCPEAVRQVLFNPAAMNFHNAQVPDSHFKTKPYSRPEWYDSVRQLCIDALLLESVSLEERLFMLGMTLKHLESRKENIDEFNQALAFCCEKIINGEFSDMFSRMDSVLEVQASFLIQVFNARLAMGILRNYPQALNRMHLLHEQLVDSIGSAGEDVNKQKEILLQGFNGNYQDYFNNNPHVWLNYFIYKMYQHDFPADNMYEVFTDIVTDFFILRGVLVAIASQRPLQESDIVLAVQSYHRSKDHGVMFSKGIKNIQKQLDVDEKLLPLMLLKMS